MIVLVKEVIAPLHGIGVVVGPFGFGEIGAVLVEPPVGRARVVDGDIQNQLHAVFVDGLAQLGQSLVPAEMGVNMEVVQAVIFVAGGGIENGV